MISNRCFWRENVEMEVKLGGVPKMRFMLWMRRQHCRCTNWSSQAVYRIRDSKLRQFKQRWISEKPITVFNQAVCLSNPWIQRPLLNLSTWDGFIWFSVCVCAHEHFFVCIWEERCWGFSDLIFFFFLKDIIIWNLLLQHPAHPHHVCRTSPVPEYGKLVTH